MSKPRWVQKVVLFLYNWAGLNCPAPAPEPTAEELIGDMTPAEIIKTWGDTLRARDLDPNLMFISMFRKGSLGLPNTYEILSRQLKWFQDHRREQQKRYASETRIDRTPRPEEIAKLFLAAALEKMIKDSK